MEHRARLAAERSPLYRHRLVSQGQGSLRAQFRRRQREIEDDDSLTMGTGVDDDLRWEAYRDGAEAVGDGKEIAVPHPQSYDRMDGLKGGASSPEHSLETKMEKATFERDITEANADRFPAYISVSDHSEGDALSQGRTSTRNTNFDNGAASEFEGPDGFHGFESAIEDREAQQLAQKPQILDYDEILDVDRGTLLQPGENLQHEYSMQQVEFDYLQAVNRLDGDGVLPDSFFDDEAPERRPEVLHTDSEGLDTASDAHMDTVEGVEDDEKRVVIHGNKVMIINQCDTFVDPGGYVVNERGDPVALSSGELDVLTRPSDTAVPLTQDSEQTHRDIGEGLVGSGIASSSEKAVRLKAHVYRLVNPSAKLQKAINKLTMQQTPGLSGSGSTRIAVEKSFTAEMRRIDEQQTSAARSSGDSGKDPADEASVDHPGYITETVLSDQQELALQEGQEYQQSHLLVDEVEPDKPFWSEEGTEGIFPSEKLEEIDSIASSDPGNYVLVYAMHEEGQTDSHPQFETSEKRLVVVRKRPLNCCHVLSLNHDLSTADRLEQEQHYGCQENYATVHGTSKSEIFISLKMTALVLVRMS
eukprot:scaffold1439_cov404-Prasinococcus_capsulatus_cf.AAC.48